MESKIYIRRRYRKNDFKNLKYQIAILQTTSQYPCNYENINLKVINNYKKISVEISDHSLVINTSLRTVVKSTFIVEKYITLDKKC